MYQKYIKRLIDIILSGCGILVLLPVYAVCFCAIPVLQFFDVRASGRTGFVNYLPPIFWGIVSLAVIAAAVVYFAG